MSELNWNVLAAHLCDAAQASPVASNQTAAEMLCMTLGTDVIDALSARMRAWESDSEHARSVVRILRPERLVERAFQFCVSDQPASEVDSWRDVLRASVSARDEARLEHHLSSSDPVTRTCAASAMVELILNHEISSSLQEEWLNAMNETGDAPTQTLIANFILTDA